MRNNRASLLCYDHGLEHGPFDFNLETCNPERALNIALEGRWTGIVLHAGIAEKYYKSYFKEVPLIISLNARSALPQTDPDAKLVCSVERAIKLGAAAVAYTIYDGSRFEENMLKEFGAVVETAHDYNLPVIAFMVPRGKFIHNELDINLSAYSARIALELGADLCVLSYNGDFEGLKWVVANAGRCKLLISDLPQQEIKDSLIKVSSTLLAGGTGIAWGHTIWKHEKPFSVSRAIERILYHDDTVEDALKLIK